MQPDSTNLTNEESQGERGVRAVEDIVDTKLGWIFRRVSGKDLGIDGYIEVLREAESGRKGVGHSLAVQVKSGESFFREVNRWGYVFRGQAKHFNYYSNHLVPVLIILHRPSTGQCFWARFSADEAEETGNHWKLLISFENDLALSRDRLLNLLPTSRDWAKEMGPEWKLQSALSESGLVFVGLTKESIDAQNYKLPQRIFARLKKNKALAMSCQGKVEIAIYGYENDLRELWEVSEVRLYIEEFLQRLPELFYFVRTEEPTDTFKLFRLCLSRVERVSFEGKPALQVFDTDRSIQFVRKGFAGLNEVARWLDLSQQEVSVITKAVITKVVQ